MRVVIAGSRTLDGEELVAAAVRVSGLKITVVIEGEAAGIDRAARRWAESKGIPVEKFHADWDTHGKRAGFIRNIDMLEADADAVIAIWDGKSTGTMHTVQEARRRGITTHVYRADPKEAAEAVAYARGKRTWPHKTARSREKSKYAKNL
jgi:hypothetical protein